MSEQEFCKIYSSFYGEKIDKVGQLVKTVLNGEELKELIEFFINETQKEKRKMKNKSIDFFNGEMPFSLNTELEKIQTNLLNELSAKFENHLEKYLQENLKKLGFEFETKSELIEFISKRVQRIGFTYKAHYWEFHLDYGTENSKFIGSYNDEVIFNREGSTITATIGINENINSF